MTNRFISAALVAALAAIGAPHHAAAQGYQYQPGDRVECNLVGSAAPQYEKYFEPGTVLAFRPGDGQDGSWFRVKADSNGVEYYCKLEVIRAVRGAPAQQPGMGGAPALAPAPRQQQAALPAANPDLLDCPVQQRQVRNGARPDEATIRKVIRCAKGEKKVAPGDEGAVQVDIHSVQIGAPRAWSYRQDAGNGQVGTQVWPVRATYSISTLYRNATEVEENWIRVLNFYVDPFGEWKIGSEESIKGGTARRINH